MEKRNYSAVFKQVSELSQAERAAMARLYLTYYDNTDKATFFRDLIEKTEVDVLYRNGVLVGFSTVLLYDAEWFGQKVRVAYSGDTIVRQDCWGQQSLSAAWLRRMGKFRAEEPSTPLYWFLLVKGHRTYRFLPSFAYEYHPDPKVSHPDLKLLADELAAHKFGKDYNRVTGVVEFERSLGNLKEEIAHPSEREARNPAVRFFLEKNPGYRRGHELVCLCPIAADNLKPFAKRIFEEKSS